MGVGGVWWALSWCGRMGWRAVLSTRLCVVFIDAFEEEGGERPGSTWPGARGWGWCGLWGGGGRGVWWGLLDGEGVLMVVWGWCAGRVGCGGSWHDRDLWDSFRYVGVGEGAAFTRGRIGVAVREFSGWGAPALYGVGRWRIRAVLSSRDGGYLGGSNHGARGCVWALEGRWCCTWDRASTDGGAWGGRRWGRPDAFDITFGPPGGDETGVTR